MPPRAGPAGQSPPAQQSPPQLIGIERPAAKRPPPTMPSSATSTAGVGAGKDIIVEVNSKNFADMVLKARCAVILDVYADWCQPCKQLTPMLERIATGAKGGLRLAKLNADKEQQLSQQLGVRSLPTVFGVVGGRMIDSFTGVQPEARMREFLEKVIGAAEGAGLVLAEGEGQGGGPSDPLAQAGEMVTNLGQMIDHGRGTEAAVTLRGLLAQLQSIEGQFQAAAAEKEAQEAAATAAAGAPPKPKRRGPAPSPVPPEVQDVIARALAATVRACLANAQAVHKEGSPSDAAAALQQAIGYGAPLVGGTQYRAAVNNADVLRGVAAAHLASSALEVVQFARELVSAAQPITKDSEPGQALKLAAAHVACGDLPAAATVALDVVRHFPSFNEGAGAEMARRIFAVLGEGHTATQAGRKRLAKLLFR